jgi:hypothetical protein
LGIAQSGSSSRGLLGWPRKHKRKRAQKQKSEQNPLPSIHKHLMPFRHPCTMKLAYFENNRRDTETQRKRLSKDYFPARYMRNSCIYLATFLPVIPSKAKDLF